MEEKMTASKIFGDSKKFMEAYHMALFSLCKETNLPPMALDLFLFLANNPEKNTAKDICQCRGLKPGIVSIYVDKLVREGLLERQITPGDRRKTKLVCTEKSKGMMQEGRKLQRQFACQLFIGFEQADLQAFHRYLEKINANMEAIRKNGMKTIRIHQEGEEE